MNLVFFSPFAVLWPHAFPESLIAASLKEKGHKITYVWCDGVFQKQCTAMAASGLDWRSSSEERSSVCQQCQHNSRLIRDHSRFESLALSTLIDKSEEGVDAICVQINRDTCFDFEFDGLSVGRIASYELFIKYKKNNYTLNDEEWFEWLIDVRHVLFALYAISNVLEKVKPDRFITYSSGYNIHHIGAAKAEATGVPSFSFEAGPHMFYRMQTMTIQRLHWFYFMDDIVRQWPLYEKQACSPAQMVVATDHLLAVMSGKSVFAYSAPQKRCDIYEFFGIDLEQKVVLATLSSYDERFSAMVSGLLPDHDDNLLFPRQVDWIQALSNYMAQHPELFLIVRVHPREFPNKRESVKSEQAQQLEEIFTDLPENVCINWPDDNISLYDIAAETDVVLNAWSSVGKELSLLGVPVLYYARGLPAYPVSMGYVSETLDGYFSCLEKALEGGDPLNRIRAMYRWYAVEFSYGVYDISDGYSLDMNQTLSLPERVLAKGRRMITPDWKEKQDIKRGVVPLAATNMIEEQLLECHATPLNARQLDEEESETHIASEMDGLRKEIKRLMVCFDPDCKLVRRLRSFISGRHD